MEFKRFETKKVLRYNEVVKDLVEVRKILEQLQKHELEFTVKLKEMGGKLGRCTILAMKGDKVLLFSNSPTKLRLSPTITEIEELEVESNCDCITEETDEGGRWSRLMS
jgi:DNA polymerase III sliding clamp (beta) subunit (PCNA family)